MKRFYLYAIACLLLIGCTDAELKELRGINYLNGIPECVKASFDSEQSRIELNDALQTVWTKGDAVSVFYNSDANNRFLYVGQTGEQSGHLERDTANAGNAMDGIVAIYPYSAEYELNTASHSVEISLAAEQHYRKGSYGLGENILVYNGNSDNFFFSNVCGWLRLQLSGAERVSRVTLRGNNGEVLAGNALLDYKTLDMKLAAEGAKQLTIDCGKEGVLLKPTEVTEFYFVVAPQSFSRGITVEITFENETTITKSTSKSLTITRNHIQPMKVIDTLIEGLDIETMPLITTYPSTIYDDMTDDIVVLVNANNTDMEGFTGDMYAHTGLITDSSTSSGDWKYVKSDWNTNTEECKLVNRGNNIWQFTIKGGVRNFYGTNPSDEINLVAFVFRSSDGSQQIKENGNDIFVGVVNREEEMMQLISTSPREFSEDSTRDIVVTLNTTSTAMDNFAGPIYAHTGVLTNKSNSTSDWRYVKADWGVNTAACKLTKVSANRWQLTIKGGPRAFYGVPESESIESLAFVFRSADGSKEVKDMGNDILVYVKNNLTRRPLGATHGVTVSGNSATFVLYAPGKNSVHLLGDFNNYASTSESLMKKDGNYFWKSIDNLRMGVEYGYQYLVDGSIRIGDPYAEKVLDPWNDKYISSSVYPNLKSYPSQASEIVSVFELMPEKYPWSVTNFDRPAKNSLAIYEMLFRDFTTEGSVKAAIEKLDYLDKLGINAIELMPIQEFDGNDSWGYNPCFYFAPDKAYGTKEDYQRFVDECHKRGIAVILDVVINHATGQFPYAKMWWNSNNNCTTSNNPFFNVYAPHPFSVYHDFNHEYSETRTYFKRMLKYWLEEYNIDGFRFDLAKGLTQRQSDEGSCSNYDASRIAIIKDYADAIRSVSDDAYIILEHFTEWSEENELANYRDILLWNNQCNPFYQSVMGYNSDSNFAGDIAWGRVSYFESHDEERIAYKALTYGQNWVKNYWSSLSSRLQGAYCLHFLSPYPKMMWQFGELGYDYSIEYNGRVGKKPVQWSYYDDFNRHALYDAVSKAISWRTSHEKMYSHDGVSYTCHVDNGDFGGKHIVYHTNEGSVIAVCNFGNSYVSFDISVPASGTWTNLMTGQKLTLGSTYKVSLSGGEYVVLVR